jgi:putative endonuclease
MALHNDFGKQAEELAAVWLAAQGYEILHRNWRHSYYEIDIIARKNDRLHIIEVKARQSSWFGYPEESVTRTKFRQLRRAADAYLSRNPGNGWLQYDILSVIIGRGKQPEFFLLEDVYF